MEIKTGRYEFAHGKKPKGKGIWFFVGPKNFGTVQAGLYSEARRKAVKRAKEFGVSHISLDS